jgi:D-glycero-alpha-D-manno-heptose-7-phosphate kinase
LLLSRTPLRITLGGGGTDLVNGTGYCVAAAINHHITVAASRAFAHEYVLRYSQTERVKTVDEIDHDLFRRAFAELGIKPGIEIATTADIPSGTGLGSSGAFLVGLLRVLLPEASRPELAELACKLDTGQQDQYAAVYGGVHAFDFEAGTLRPISTRLDEHLHLFYTGVSRDTAPVAVDPERARCQADAAVAALENNDPELLGACLQEQWNSKLAAQPTTFHKQMDAQIRAGNEIGAHGGKLVGAGNGGFLLFAGDPDPILMRRMGLVEVPFRFEHEGTRCV